jgi:hypothetical protein
MPAEAIHLTMLETAISRATPPVRQLFSTNRLRGAARSGALLVDLPYFGGLRRTLMRYALRFPSAPSPWAKTFHHRAPVGLLASLLEQSRALMTRDSVKDSGEWLRAFSLGYLTHIVADRAMHPTINRLARQRRRALGRGTLARLHQDVEKVQSVVFHGERLRRDLLGTSELVPFLTIDSAPLSAGGEITHGLSRACTKALGETPARAEVRRWSRGYSEYVRLLSGPLGRVVVSRRERDEQRHWAYDAVRFPELFEATVARVTEALEQVGRCDDLTRLTEVIAEGTLDPGADERADSPEDAASPAWLPVTSSVAGASPADVG